MRPPNVSVPQGPIVRRINCCCGVPGFKLYQRGFRDLMRFTDAVRFPVGMLLRCSRHFSRSIQFRDTLPSSKFEGDSSLVRFRLISVFACSLVTTITTLAHAIIVPRLPGFLEVTFSRLVSHWPCATSR